MFARNRASIIFAYETLTQESPVVKSDIMVEV